jgi:ABC-type glycerol-3-phosphate transport system substrate-binding protein
MTDTTKTLQTGRRTLLAGAATSLLAPRLARAQTPITLTMAVWAAQAEEEAFNAAIARYKAVRPEVTIKLEVSGNAGQTYQNVDTRLAGRQGPDLFRVQYQQVGRYASARAIIDLTQHVASEAADFGPAFWNAASYKGRQFAMPHHTDTFAVYYNREMFQKIGVEPPTTLDKAWTWQQFIAIARDLKAKAGAPYGFAMGWQNAAYRWLPFLYQHGGTLLSPDLTKSTITAREGIETIAWTQSWFKEGLVPPSTSVKSSEQPQALFANGTVGMIMAGDWQIPFLTKNMTKYNWGVTFMPRDVAMASDLGGNCFAITRDSKNQDAAADFLKFLTNTANMKDFISSAQFLPVRKSLMTGPLPYALRPEAMDVFVRQSATIPDHLVSTVTLPNFSKINAALTDQLDLAFTSGQTAEATARAIDEQVAAVLAA